MSTPVTAGPIIIPPELLKCPPLCFPKITIKSEPSPGQGNLIEAQKGGRTITFIVTPTGFVNGDVTVDCGKYGDGEGSNQVKVEFEYTFKNPDDNLITVNCTAEGADGKIVTSPFKFKYDDTQAPYFKKGDQTIEREATGIQTQVDFLSYVKSFVKDNVDSNLDISCEPESGSVFSLGTHTVECYATDDRGNNNEADPHEFEIYVSDKTAPKLYVPTDINAIATSSSGATVNYNVSANDLVDGQLQPVCSHASGSEFPFGSTQVTCSATDTSSYPKANTISDSFYVTIGDSSTPTIDLVSEPKVKPGQSGLIVIYSVKGTDKIDGTINVECNPPSGSEFQPGTTIIKCIASDSHGNNATKIITFSY